MSSGGLAEKLLERATLYIRVKDWERALATLRDATCLNPALTEAWILRGNVLLNIKEDALSAALHYERALSINQYLPDAWNNLGNCFSKMHMYKTARDAYRRSFEAKRSWEPLTGLGNMYCNMMDLKQAEEYYQQALDLDNAPDHYFNIGMVQLGQGNWKQGYPNYCYRWRDDPNAPIARRALPQWNGESLEGKTIVLYPDQGYGDEIMTMRFASRDYLKGARKIILQTRAALADIARYSGADEIRPLHGALPKADYAACTMDMPMHLGLGWDKVKHPPYLRTDKTCVEYWKERLPKGFNLGICWMSGGHFSTTLSIQRTKSLPIDYLRLLQQPGVNLICLQKPIMEKVPPEVDLINYMDEIDDFSDTAALIGALDLTISVDTAVAHMAGALGAPVWNMVRFSGYWPWLAPDVAGPDKSIWYDSMKLYRQPRGQDWDEPMQRVCKDLETLLENRHRAN